MNRKNLLLVAGGALLFMAACQSSTDQIVRKWQVTSMENPIEDSMIKVQEHSIDTISTLDSNMITYFGSSNLDSIKTVIKKNFKENIDNSKKQQEEFIKQLTMDFHKDSTLIQEGGGRADTLKYALDDKKKELTLSLKNAPAGMPNKPVVMKIEKLTSSELRLKVQQEGQSSGVYINLKPAAEKKAEEKKAEEKK